MAPNPLRNPLEGIGAQYPNIRSYEPPVDSKQNASKAPPQNYDNNGNPIPTNQPKDPNGNPIPTNQPKDPLKGIVGGSHSGGSSRTTTPPSTSPAPVSAPATVTQTVNTDLLAGVGTASSKITVQQYQDLKKTGQIAGTSNYQQVISGQAAIFNTAPKYSTTGSAFVSQSRSVSSGTPVLDTQKATGDAGVQTLSSAPAPATSNPAVDALTAEVNKQLQEIAEGKRKSLDLPPVPSDVDTSSKEYKQFMVDVGAAETDAHNVYVKNAILSGRNQSTQLSDKDLYTIASPLIAEAVPQTLRREAAEIALQNAAKGKSKSEKDAITIFNTMPLLPRV